MTVRYEQNGFIATPIDDLGNEYGIIDEDGNGRGQIDKCFIEDPSFGWKKVEETLKEGDTVRTNCRVGVYEIEHIDVIEDIWERLGVKYAKLKGMIGNVRMSYLEKSEPLTVAIGDYHEATQQKEQQDWRISKFSTEQLMGLADGTTKIGGKQYLVIDWDQLMEEAKKRTNQ